MFFLLSGYSISISWNKDPNLKRYYLKRYFSIAPGYYLMIVIMTILTLAAKATIGKTVGFAGNTDPGAILINVLLLNGLFPNADNNVVGGGWYIGTTVIFYLLYPILNQIIKNAKHRRLIVVATIAAKLIIIITVYKITGNASVLTVNSFTYYSFINEITCFLLGIVLFYRIQEEKESPNPTSDIILSLFWLVISLGLFFGAGKYAYVFVTDAVGLLSFYLARAFITIEKRGAIQKDKLSRYLSAWGRRSFYIYLSHTFFAFSMSIIIVTLWERAGEPFNVNVLYLITIPVVFLGAWILSVILEAIISPITKKGYQLLLR